MATAPPRRASFPLRFEPFLRPMVWGGRRLAEVLGKRLETAGPHGESWELSDHPLHRSRVAEGPLAGTSLRGLMETDAAGLLGPAARQHSTFPWLVKFLDAEDWLSVQVHPDTDAVGRLWPGEGSKTEAWFVLDARPGSKIFAGLKPGVDEKRLRAALAGGTVTDCLHQFAPRAGECVFLPAGTVHAVGGGVLMAEVQQTSDATFRLYDWDRRDAQGQMRTLHVEEAMACIHWDKGPVQPVRAAGFADAAGSAARQLLVRCPYFVLEFVRENQPFVLGGQERLQILIVLRGKAQMNGPDHSSELLPGQTWLLPAGMPGCQCRPDSSLQGLLCTLP